MSATCTMFLLTSSPGFGSGAGGKQRLLRASGEKVHEGRFATTSRAHDADEVEGIVNLSQMMVDVVVALKHIVDSLVRVDVGSIIEGNLFACRLDADGLDTGGLDAGGLDAGNMNTGSILTDDNLAISILTIGVVAFRNLVKSVFARGLLTRGILAGAQLADGRVVIILLDAVVNLKPSQLVAGPASNQLETLLLQLTFHGWALVSTRASGSLRRETETSWLIAYSEGSLRSIDELFMRSVDVLKRPSLLESRSTGLASDDCNYAVKETEQTGQEYHTG